MVTGDTLAANVLNDFHILKVLAENGLKSVCQVTIEEKGVLIITCAIVSAAGQYISPAMIFPRVNFKAHMLKGAPAGTLGLASQSGWMKAELFLEVIKHFVKHTFNSTTNPTLLIYDNHKSHLSISVLDFAKENGVTILTFPPHSTNKIQLLDVGLFRNIFSEIDFLPSSTTDRKEPVIVEPSESVLSTTAANVTIAPVTTMCPANKALKPVAPVNPGNEIVEPLTSTSTGNKLIESIRPLSIPKFLSPEDFRGFLKAGQRKRTQRGKKLGRSLIATDTPEKEDISKKSRKCEIQKKAKRRVMQESSSSEEEENINNLQLMLTLSCRI